MSSKKVAMLHVNVRLPVEVVDYFKREYPEYTKAMRDVLVRFTRQSQDIPPQDIPLET